MPNTIRAPLDMIASSRVIDAMREARVEAAQF